MNAEADAAVVHEPFTPVEEADDGSASAATLFTCPLCNGRFSHGAHVCWACPFAVRCDVVSCPHCGYSFPRTSRLLAWVRRRIRSKN